MIYGNNKKVTKFTPWIESFYSELIKNNCEFHQNISINFGNPSTSNIIKKETHTINLNIKMILKMSLLNFNKRSQAIEKSSQSHYIKQIWKNIRVVRDLNNSITRYRRIQSIVSLRTSLQKHINADYGNRHVFYQNKDPQYSVICNQFIPCDTVIMKIPLSCTFSAEEWIQRPLLNLTKFPLSILLVPPTWNSMNSNDPPYISIARNILKSTLHQRGLTDPLSLHSKYVNSLRVPDIKICDQRSNQTESLKEYAHTHFLLQTERSNKKLNIKSKYKKTGSKLTSIKLIEKRSTFRCVPNFPFLSHTPVDMYALREFNAFNKQYETFRSSLPLEALELVEWAVSTALYRSHIVYNSSHNKHMLVMAPGIDMINHSSQPNIKISLNNDYLVAYTIQNINKGSEIQMNYVDIYNNPTKSTDNHYDTQYLKSLYWSMKWGMITK